MNPIPIVGLAAAAVLLVAFRKNKASKVVPFESGTIPKVGDRVRFRGRFSGVAITPEVSRGMEDGMRASQEAAGNTLDSFRVNGNGSFVFVVTYGGAPTEPIMLPAQVHMPPVTFFIASGERL